MRRNIRSRIHPGGLFRNSGRCRYARTCVDSLKFVRGSLYYLSLRLVQTDHLNQGFHRAQ